MINGIGHAQVAFGILEIYGVDLVRHCRRTDLAGHHLLAEILHRDVCPDVAGKINKDGVDARQAVENGSQIVVMLYLCGGPGVRQTKLFLYETVGESLPVYRRIGHVMGIHIAGGAAEFGGI